MIWQAERIGDRLLQVRAHVGVCGCKVVGRVVAAPGAPDGVRGVGASVPEDALAAGPPLHEVLQLPSPAGREGLEGARDVLAALFLRLNIVNLYFSRAAAILPNRPLTIRWISLAFRNLRTRLK